MEECSAELMDRAKTADYCGLMADVNGPFAECHSKVSNNR